MLICGYKRILKGVHINLLNIITVCPLLLYHINGMLIPAARQRLVKYKLKKHDQQNKRQTFSYLDAYPHLYLGIFVNYLVFRTVENTSVLFSVGDRDLLSISKNQATWNRFRQLTGA